MRKKSVLIYCDTPFQIMMAIRLRQSDLKDDDVDLIIADHINNFYSLFENIKKSKVFRNVYIMEAYELDYRKGEFGGSKIKYLIIIALRKRILNKLLYLNETYDEFFATDILNSTNMIYDFLIKLNPDIKMVFYEEGPVSVLSDQNNQFGNKPYGSLGTLKKIFFRLLRYRTIEGNYAYGYSSVNDLSMKALYFPMLSIPILDRNDKHYIEILNRIWGYASEEHINQKIIFFEESFFLNGIECTDMQIVKDLADCYGKENIIVKLHPRSRVNRFQSMGVSTNRDSSVPWELISLNIMGREKILVALSTGSLIHPQLYWGIEQHAVCLAECNEYKFKYLDCEYYQKYIHICRNKELVFLPADKSEMFKIIDNLMKY